MLPGNISSGEHDFPHHHSALSSTTAGTYYSVLGPLTSTTPTTHLYSVMAPTVHEINPDYDTIIVLRDPGTNFAGAVENPRPQDTAVHYHVSSQHLQLASPWFKRAMAEDTWSESKLEDGKYRIIAHDWDEQAFLMLLNILHLQTKQVPRIISLELLAKVGVLVDYYEYGEAIEMFTAMWIDKLKRRAIPNSYCRDLVLWIWIAWVFGLAKQFEKASIVAIKNSTKTIDTLGLPIPASVSSKYRIYYNLVHMAEMLARRN